MAQITIYLDESTELAARDAAARANLSVSRWFAQFAEAEKAKRNLDWKAYWADVDQHKAAWQDFPLTETLNLDLVADTTRETL
jgi:hypothetical protein